MDVYIVDPNNYLRSTLFDTSIQILHKIKKNKSNMFLSLAIDMVAGMEHDFGSYWEKENKFKFSFYTQRLVTQTPSFQLPIPIPAQPPESTLLPRPFTDRPFWIVTQEPSSRAYPCLSSSRSLLQRVVFQGLLPPSIAVYFTDAYLFLLHKDPDDPTKLRPIAIPSGMRRLTASHIMASYRQRFAIDMLPLNYAIGVDGDMDFIIKTVQLGTEKHISLPQSRNELPTRVAVFLNLKNMFDNISRQELMNVIAEDYPELLPIANLLYHDLGVIHYQWEDGT